MKKAIAIIFSILLIITIFCGCKTKNYTPDVTADFSQSAKITSGDFSYECKISRKSMAITVSATSTRAKGLEITCSGDKISYTYNDMSYEAQAIDTEKKNPALAIYEVFDTVTNDESIFAKKTDTGYKYEGKTSIGKFVLYQNDDNTFSSIHFLESDMLIEF